MDAAGQREQRLALGNSSHELTGVPDYARRGPVRNRVVARRQRLVEAIGERTQSGAENDRNGWDVADLPAQISGGLGDAIEKRRGHGPTTASPQYTPT